MAANFTPSSFLCTRFFRRASRKALSWDLWPVGRALYAPSPPAFTRECFLFSILFNGIARGAVWVMWKSSWTPTSHQDLYNTRVTPSDVWRITSIESCIGLFDRGELKTCIIMDQYTVFVPADCWWRIAARGALKCQGISCDNFK